MYSLSDSVKPYDSFYRTGLAFYRFGKWRAWAFPDLPPLLNILFHRSGPGFRLGGAVPGDFSSRRPAD
jgi:hypothetical protein